MFSPPMYNFSGKLGWKNRGVEKKCIVMLDVLSVFSMEKMGVIFLFLCLFVVVVCCQVLLVMPCFPRLAL